MWSRKNMGNGVEKKAKILKKKDESKKVKRKRKVNGKMYAKGGGAHRVKIVRRK
jgi:hypothetical protein